jgi:isoleucyl-tRNA synthetase
MENMDQVMKICSLGRSARSKAGIKLRQPLSEVKIAAKKSILERVKKFEDIIKNELNVKNLYLTYKKDELIEYFIKPIPKLLGKKYGKYLSRIQKTITGMDMHSLALRLEKGLNIELEIDGKQIELLPEELDVITKPKKGFSLSEEEDILVSINVNISPILKMEGLARDIVRHIQNQRKEADFKIADLITTYYETGPKLTEVFENFGDYISTETLSISIIKAASPEDAYENTFKINGETLKIGLLRTSKK